MQKMSLKALRVNAGLSQREAASKIGVSVKTLCFWEKGKAFPKQPMIEKICNAYGCTYDVINFDIIR